MFALLWTSLLYIILELLPLVIWQHWIFAPYKRSRDVGFHRSMRDQFTN